MGIEIGDRKDLHLPEEVSSYPVKDVLRQMDHDLGIEEVAGYTGHRNNKKRQDFLPQA
jgi:hypothetical protein